MEDGWPKGGEIELLNDTSFKIEDDVLRLMMKMVDDMIKHHVQLVACQKIIHPTLQHYITSHNLYFVERLSIFHIEAMQKLTGAKLISSCLAKISEDSYGSLKEMKLLTIQKKR